MLYYIIVYIYIYLFTGPEGFIFHSRCWFLMLRTLSRVKLRSEPDVANSNSGPLKIRVQLKNSPSHNDHYQLQLMLKIKASHSSIALRKRLHISPQCRLMLL